MCWAHCTPGSPSKISEFSQSRGFDAFCSSNANATNSINNHGSAAHDGFGTGSVCSLRGTGSEYLEIDEVIYPGATAKVPHWRSCDPSGKRKWLILIAGKGGTRTLDPGIMRALDRKNRA
jgi:hypothetical protein